MEALETKKKSSEIKSDNQIDNHALKVFISKLIETVRTPDNKKTLEEIAGELRNGTKRKISDDLFTSIIDKINLLSDKYRNAKSKEFSDAVINTVCDDLRKNSSEPVSIFSPRINKLLKPKERAKPMNDTDVIKEVRAILAQALQDVPESDGNRALRHVVKKAEFLLSQISAPSRTDIISENSESINLPTELPEVAPIKWADRKTFIVNKIEDDFTRKRLETTPNLEEQIRQSANVKDFFSLVWHPFVMANLLYRVNLTGQKRTTSNQTPKPPLDKTLADLLWKSCTKEELNIILPNKSEQVNKIITNKIDEIISEMDIDKARNLTSTSSSFRRRIY
jgi:hypothetical protein